MTSSVIVRKFHHHLSRNSMEELIQNIDKLMEKASTNKSLENLDLMAKVIVGLASYMYTLSNYIAEADREEATLEEHLKFTREGIIKEVIEGKRGEKKTEAYAKALARIETQSESEDYLKARYNSRMLNLKRMSVNTFIDTVRSRLSQKKQEISQIEVV